MKMTPKEAIDHILEDAPGILQKDKYHAPILFIFGEKENAIALIEFKDSRSKRKAMWAAGIKAAPLQPYCIAFVSEAWMAKQFPPEGKEIHDMPDKEECLVVAAQSIDRETQVAAIPFSRVGGEVILGETIYTPETASYLLELFWRGVAEGSD